MGFECFFFIITLIIWRVYSLEYAGAIVRGSEFRKEKNENGFCKGWNTISERALYNTKTSLVHIDCAL